MSETQMELSEAIRLGAMLKPQGYGGLHITRRTGWFNIFGKEMDSTCALGAAFEAAGCQTVPAGPRDQPFRPIRGSAKATHSIQIPPHWNQVLNHCCVCPECEVRDDVTRLIPHLNDKHRWTRVSIADFVETIEIQLRHRADERVDLIFGRIKPQREY